MIPQPRILVFVSDRALRSSLLFSLTIEGYHAVAGAPTGSGPAGATALLIDQDYCGDGLGTLVALRARGYSAPAIFLATNPGASLRARATSAGAVTIEKPLLGDELSGAIRAAINTQEAA
ncbi:hypothetical protein GCM10011515_04200 [Tsuneonella deserti]|uniref:Response regulatory domain-containing protein n=1 Tax=Tsuneonella deserti TaxID=2035528 RepID=A0ABQ1RYY4_9SPHN|nr:histidine kinase [Tsuneonella deserti]GGD87735.1 hypothetical protein GCM10011515_04200 [Tsuneonella deserti]